MTHSARVAAVRQNRRMARNRNTTQYKGTSRLGPVSNSLIVGLIITALGLLYLVQVTKTSVYGFELNDLKESQEELTKTNQSLEVQAARLQSLERIEDSELVKDFEPASELGYLPAN